MNRLLLWWHRWRSAVWMARLHRASSMAVYHNLAATEVMREGNPIRPLSPEEMEAIFEKMRAGPRVRKS